MPRVSTYTLGCKLNYAETSTLEDQFKQRDFELVPFGEPADVTVINTCSVTSSADRKCRKMIRRARRASPDAFIAVTGCYAQLQPEAIAEIDGVDLVLGSGEKLDLLDWVNGAFERPEKTQVEVSCIDEVDSFGPAFSSGERTRAFLKIQDGCDYGCTFCTIPMARGGSRSQPHEEVLAQAREIARRGYREIVLTGVNIGLYGRDLEGAQAGAHGASGPSPPSEPAGSDDDVPLLRLLRDLDDVEQIERYRISSIEPDLLTDDVIEFVADSRAFLPHFHMPLQSGDDEVLKKMARRYRRRRYRERVETIRTLMPEASIGVDVIVGFPAETEERFRRSYRFVHELPVSYLHAFTYSERPNTPAAEHTEMMGGNVPEAERKRRNRMLRILSEKKQRAHARAHLDSRRSVLWENEEHEGAMFGYTDNYIRVEAPFDSDRVGRLESVRLGEIAESGRVRVDT